jgi:hypothetical protein
LSERERIRIHWNHPKRLANAITIPCSRGHTSVFVLAAVTNDWDRDTKGIKTNTIWIGFGALGFLSRGHWNHLETLAVD